MRFRKVLWVYFAGITLLVGALSACGDDECQKDSDCAAGQVCATGSGVLFGGSSCIAESRVDLDAATLDTSIPENDLGRLADVSTEPDSTGIEHPDLTNADASVDACIETTDEELCQQMSVECGLLDAVDSCGVSREVFCGACEMPEMCSDQGICECVPETNDVFCTRLTKDCDEVTNLDNCGVERTVDCGPCPGNEVCGESAENVCGCPCEIDGQCYPAGAINPMNECQECNPGASTSAWSNRSGSCDDGDPCTEDDACSQGTCAGTPKTCSAPGQCQSAQCQSSTGLCQTVDLTGSTCDDGNACTTSDSCAAGTCTGLERSCPDPGPCKTASCDPVTGDCVTMNLPDGTSCDDGDACTSNETCSAGVCEPQALVFCTPSGPCKTSECNPATGSCEESNRLDGASCNDNNACTTNDQCTSGSCAGTPVVCSDPGTCQTASCNPQTGNCDVRNNSAGAACDDGLFCTVNTTCDGSGNCTGSPRACLATVNCTPYCNESANQCEQILCCDPDDGQLCPIELEP